MSEKVREVRGVTVMHDRVGFGGRVVFGVCSLSKDCEWRSEVRLEKRNRAHIEAAVQKILQDHQSHRKQAHPSA